MIAYILLGLIFTSFFTVKSLFFNYAFSSSLCFIYPFEILALITYNSKYVSFNNCIDCMNILIEWILLGWLGLPLENNAIKLLIPNDDLILDNMKIVILVSWLIALSITLIVKAFHYRCKYGIVYISNIIKVLLKFCFTNYTPLLLWSLVSFIKKNSLYVVKFWFELFNLGLFLFLLFGVKSLIMYILYGDKRVFYRSMYMFIHNRFKKNNKLWLVFVFFMKDLLILPTSLMLMNTNSSLNNIIVNYILVGLMIIYSIINFKINPFKINERNDYFNINIVNLLSLIFIFFNEISLYLTNDKTVFILWIVKSIILVILLGFSLTICYKNYQIEKQLSDNKKNDIIQEFEITKFNDRTLPTSIDIDV